MTGGVLPPLTITDAGERPEIPPPPVELLLADFYPNRGGIKREIPIILSSELLDLTPEAILSMISP